MTYEQIIYEKEIIDERKLYEDAENNVPFIYHENKTYSVRAEYRNSVFTHDLEGKDEKSVVSAMRAFLFCMEGVQAEEITSITATETETHADDQQDDDDNAKENRFFSVNVKYGKTSVTKRLEAVDAEDAKNYMITIIRDFGVKDKIESLSVVELIKTETGFEIK